MLAGGDGFLAGRSLAAFQLNLEDDGEGGGEIVIHMVWYSKIK